MQDTSYEANVDLINKFSWSVLRRVKAAGYHSADINDIRQELSIAWMMSQRSYNEVRGVPFRPYMMNGMKLYINRWCKKEIFQAHLAPTSLDKPMTEDGGQLHEAIPDDQIEDPDVIIDRKRKLQRVMRRLSRRAAKFLELLEDPPEDLSKIVTALKARADYARSMGFSTFMSSNITESLIFDLMGASGPERTMIRKEIKAAIERVGSK